VIIIYYDGGGGRPTGDLHARVTFIARRPCTFPDEFCAVRARSRAISLKNIDVCFADETGNVYRTPVDRSQSRVRSETLLRIFFHSFFFFCFFFFFFCWSSDFGNGLYSLSAGRHSQTVGSGAKFSRTVQMCSSGHRTRLRGSGSPAGYYIIQSCQSIYILHVSYILYRNIEIPSTSLPSRGGPGVRYRPFCRRRHPSCRPFRPLRAVWGPILKVYSVLGGEW